MANTNILFNGDFTTLPADPLIDTIAGPKYINGKSGGGLSDTYGWFFDDLNIHQSTAGFIRGGYHYGGGAVKLTNTTVTAKCSVNSRLTPIRPNTVYELEAYVDLDNVPDSGAYIKINYHRPNESIAFDSRSTQKVGGTATCKRISATFTTTSGMANIKLELRNTVAGNVSSVTFHDITIREKADLVPPSLNIPMIYGVNSPFDPLGPWTTADLQNYCAKMKEMGATYIRASFVADYIHPVGGTTYTYTIYDKFVNIAGSYGIRVMPILNYSTTTLGTPEFADYFTNVAAHFKPLGVRYYELWNEKNLYGQYNHDNNPATYAAILKEAYPAIKLGDPTAKVLMTGVTGGSIGQTEINIPTYPGNEYSPSDYLRGIYENGGGNYFDILNYHPYGHTDAVPQAMRQVAAEYGDELKPMAFTEDGIPTAGKTGQLYTDEAGQAQYMEQAIEFAKKYSASFCLFYNGNDSGGGVSTDREAHFGVTKGPLSALVEKQAFGVIKGMITGA